MTTENYLLTYLLTYLLIYMVVGVLLSRARQPGIRCQTVFATQHRVSTCLGISWRQYSFCEILTRCTQRIRDLSIMHHINVHLTHTCQPLWFWHIFLRFLTQIMPLWS